MTNNPGKILILNLVLLLLTVTGNSQVLDDLGIEKSHGLHAYRIVLDDSSTVVFQRQKVLYSFMLNDKLHTSGEAGCREIQWSFSSDF